MSVTSIRRGSETEKINAALEGFTELRGLELTCNGATLRYRLRLTLARQKANETLTLLCHDVQHLELNPTGEQFTRMMKLRVEDVREEGLERVHFALDELESGTIFLHCADVELA